MVVMVVRVLRNKVRRMACKFYNGGGRMEGVESRGIMSGVMAVAWFTTVDVLRVP